MIITKHKRDINLLVLQFGAAIAVSLAGFLYSRFLKRRRTKPTLPSRRVRSLLDHSCRGCLDIPLINEDAEPQNTNKNDSVVDLCPNSHSDADEKDVFLLPDFEDVVKEVDLWICNDNETPKSDTSAPLAFPSEEDIDHEKEIVRLKNTIRALHENERSLEAKLLEYYNLKEQQKVAMELRNRLKLNQMETKVFNLKIKSLQAENEKLKTQCSEHAKVVSELEAAKSRIQVMKKKLLIEAQRNRDQISSLKDRVAKLQEQELKACLPNPDADKMVQRLRDLEAEIDELKDSNMKLQIENLELAEKLESTQLLVNSKLEDSETEALREEDNRLRNENEELKREIEQLQADRCTDVEELVYLRWINACLRYELRNYQPPIGKTIARDLSITLSPKSEEKAKHLILEYAQTEEQGENAIHTMDLYDDQWSSSLESLITDSEYLDDSSMDTSLASKANKRGKKNLMRKLRKLLHGKDVQMGSNNEKPRSPECWDHLTSSSSAGINSTPQLRSRHSMDFQMLMRNKADEFNEDVDIAHHKSKTSSSVFRTLREGEAEPDSDHANKTELIKFAEALKNSRSTNKKLHKKSLSYFF